MSQSKEGEVVYNKVSDTDVYDGSWIYSAAINSYLKPVTLSKLIEDSMLSEAIGFVEWVDKEGWFRSSRGTYKGKWYKVYNNIGEGYMTSEGLYNEWLKTKLTNKKSDNCEKCGDKFWLYDEQGQRIGGCTCHY